LSTGQTEVCTT